MNQIQSLINTCISKTKKLVIKEEAFDVQLLNLYFNPRFYIWDVPVICDDKLPSFVKICYKHLDLSFTTVNYICESGVRALTSTTKVLEESQ